TVAFGEAVTVELAQELLAFPRGEELRALEGPAHHLEQLVEGVPLAGQPDGARLHAPGELQAVGCTRAHHDPGPVSGQGGYEREPCPQLVAQVEVEQGHGRA